MVVVCCLSLFLFLQDPVPSIQAHPSPSNLLEWHYVLQGAKDSDYEGGVYHGKVVFPSQYPYKYVPRLKTDITHLPLSCSALPFLQI